MKTSPSCIFCNNFLYLASCSFSTSAIFSFNILISSSDKFFISLIWLIRSEFNSFSFSIIFSCRLCFNSSFKVFPCSTVIAPLSINSSINFLDFSLVLAIAPTPNKNAFFKSSLKLLILFSFIYYLNMCLSVSRPVIFHKIYILPYSKNNFSIFNNNC